MTEIVNPLIINEIRVLWSDYLHDSNSVTLDYRSVSGFFNCVFCSHFGAFIGSIFSNFEIYVKTKKAINSMAFFNLSTHLTCL
jgi:hypothetical protein